MRYLQKAFYMVRQAHHERKKVNKFNTTTVRPELVEGQLPGVLQVPLMIGLFKRWLSIDSWWLTADSMGRYDSSQSCKVLALISKQLLTAVD
jgi:hypothetical protein